MEALDFWQVHGIWFLIFIAIFPRLTMLLTGILFTMGPIGWIGWIFAPHVTVAVLASLNYWDTNPLLVIIAWLVALGGTGGEAKAASRSRN